MTEREAFQAGFLLKCAEDGLSAEETRARIKAAFNWAYPLGEMIEAPGRVLSAVGPPALYGTAALGIGGPIALGIGGGYAAAKLTDDDSDVGAAKQEETIAEYQRLADQARRQAAIKALRGRPTLAHAPAVA